jgi:hypothetical protein
MTVKSKLPGVKIYKSFEDFIKDISQSLEKEHNFVHSAHKRQVRDLTDKTVKKGSP